MKSLRIVETSGITRPTGQRNIPKDPNSQKTAVKSSNFIAVMSLSIRRLALLMEGHCVVVRYKLSRSTQVPFDVDYCHLHGLLK